jgi:hypothetical protein
LLWDCDNTAAPLAVDEALASALVDVWMSVRLCGKKLRIRSEERKLLRE